MKAFELKVLSRKKLRRNDLLSRHGSFSENLQEKQDGNNCSGFWDQTYSIRLECNKDFCTGKMVYINIWESHY